MTDLEIIEALRRGGTARERAEAFMYRAWREAALGVILKKAKGPGVDLKLVKEQALAAFREAFLPFVRRVSRPDFGLHSATLQTYFVTCVRNRWTRKHPLNRPDFAVPEDEHLTDFAKSVEQTMIEAELALLVEKSLSHLSVDCREVLTMFKNGYRMEEIAQKMGWASADVAKSRKCECSKKYRKTLESQPELLKLVKELCYG